MAGWRASSLLLFLSLIATACVQAAGGEGGGSASGGQIVLEAGPPAPPAPFLTDSAIVGLPQGSVHLSGRPSGGLIGWLSPVGVPSADGRMVAYNAWEELTPIDPHESLSQQGVQPGDAVGTPSIRLIDLQTSEDTLFEQGAFSIAWRADGAVAYLEGSEQDFHVNRPGRVPSSG